MVLFGWFLCPSRASLDIVVAFAVDEVSFSGFRPNLQTIPFNQGVLLEINRKMPLFLRMSHCSRFSWISALLVKCKWMMERIVLRPLFVVTFMQRNINTCLHERWSCGCYRLHGFLEQCKQDSGSMFNWIQLLCNSQDFFVGDSHLLPQLHHMHFDGEIDSDCDVHIIIYESPTYGGHHFSLSFFSFFEQETTILAINSAIAAKTIFLTQMGQEGFEYWFPFICLFTFFMKQLFGTFISSFSTLFYLILQLVHCTLSYGSDSWIYHTLAKLFSHTWKILHIQCCQILYWPILLQGNGLRSKSCVEHAEKGALHKHFLWSNVAADILLGNFIGLALLVSAESTCIWVLNYAIDIRNNLFVACGVCVVDGSSRRFQVEHRAGWNFRHDIPKYYPNLVHILGIAISGMVFGFTIPAALTVDTIRLSTLHVATIHWLLSVMYSVQIQALAALWRLFRGRKWNPLRKRFDSFDYSVEQHAVGSLLFSPLLLLLPTTSVFYIFFSILESTICFVCIMIEVTISVVHATPYITILFWLLRQRRFPYGIWFENILCQRDGIGSPENRQILSPYYKNVFSGISCSLIASSAYGVLSEKRFPSSLGLLFLRQCLGWYVMPACGSEGGVRKWAGAPRKH
ncbi:Phosphatidylinositol N-acetylglucosaminyltransferase subunit Q/GPI1 [Dillenia turbinata]|uniref:Phosphatidylinositol N-acetylglucosaminyltransferase subunit Q/GPI1 n=1 Tax=Dillenia turbinata TaxID=194707 RepID=A0AAN8VVL4_9MAGN